MPIIENFEPQPNHYYISGAVEKDIFTRAQYGDTYDGQSVSGMIWSGDNEKLYIAQSQTPELPVYGSADAKINSLTLSYYTHNIDTVRQFHTPLLKIYPVAESTDLTEGQLDILPLEHQQMGVFCSYVNDDNYILKETFNGTNSGYQDRDDYNKQIYMGTNIREEGIWTINGKDLYEMIKDKGFLKWGWLSEQRAKTYFNSDTNFVLHQKASNGLWVVSKYSATFEGTIAYIPTRDEAPYVSETGDMQYTIEHWKEYGATQALPIDQMTAQQYDVTDIDFVDRVTQFNSIFNYVREAPDAEDIKVQTVGNTGDTTKFYTYSRVGLQSSDKLTGGAAAQFTNFWENYTGADSQYSPYYGTTDAGTALPQTCMASMDYLPRPFPFDMGSSGSRANNEGAGPVCNLSIDMTLKFADMPPALLTYDTYSGQAGPIGSAPSAMEKQMHLNRGFAVILSQDYPWANENFYSYLKRLKDNNRTATGLFFYAKYDKTNDQQPTVYGIPFLNLVSGAVTSGSSLQTGNDPDVFFISGGIHPHEAYALNNNPNYFEFPMNQWQDIVISYGMPNLNANGAGDYAADEMLYQPKDWLLAYSPTALLSGGAYQTVKLELADGHFGPSSAGQSYKNVNLNSMSLWCNNQRACETSKDDTSAVDFRNTSADLGGFTDDDTTISVLVDSIGIKDANWKIGNATINKNNPEPSNIVIPAAPNLRPVHMASGNYRVDNATDEGIPPTIDSTFWPNVSIYRNFGISGQVGIADNYYGLANTPTHSNICFGFEDIDELIAPENGGGEINLLMNNYFTNDPNQVNGITASYISGSYSAGNRIGISGNTFNGVTVNRNTSATGMAIFTSGGASTGRVDDMTQKGFITVTGLSNISGSWTKRENIFVSARIIGSNADGSIIEVDNPSVFDMPTGPASAGGTDYIMYNFWESYGKYYKTVTSGNAAGDTVPLYQIKPRIGNTIYLNRPTNITDDKTNTLCSSNKSGVGIGPWYASVNDRKLGSILIGPKKHWLNLSICNMSGSLLPTGSSPTDYWGSWVNPDITFYTLPQRLAMRSYTAVTPTSGTTTGTAGSTFREWNYTDGVYSREWNLGNNGEGIIEVNKDYGFGVYTPATENAAEYLGGYINETFPSVGWSYPKLDSYVKVNKVDWNQPFNFSLYPFLENSGFDNYYGINISTKDGTYPPYLIWGVEDTPPVLSNLTVQGNTNILKDENPFNITPNLLNTVKFDWEEESSEDIWYRYLIVDKDPVYDKYHKASIYTHLNSSTAATQKVFINYASRHHKTTTGSLPLYASGGVGVTFEGFAGYGTTYDGNGGTTLMSTDNLQWMQNQNKGSIIAHVVPNAGSGTIVEFNQELTSNATGSAFTLGMSSSRVVAHINPMGIKTGGGSLYSATGHVSLSGTSSFLCNGEEPIAIALTFDGPAETANWKLYVNGMLEDSQNYSTTGALEIQGNMYIGGRRQPASGGSALAAMDNFNGRIEEVVCYNDLVLQFPTEEEYIYDTSTDLNFGWRDGGSIYSIDERNSFNGRVFAADYHNIRGKTPKEIGMSNQVGWRVSGI